jgi:hypothetical protein
MAGRVHKRPVGRPRKSLERYQNGGLTEKRRQLIASMVWDGLPLKAAAAAVGYSECAARQAMRMPEVLAHFEAERRALLAGERVRNIDALRDVRDAADNSMARVAAVKALETMIDSVQAGDGTGRQTAGIVIVIPGAHADAARGLPHVRAGGFEIDTHQVDGVWREPAHDPRNGGPVVRLNDGEGRG